MLILASESPRRRALLAEAGFEFTTVAPRVREKGDPQFSLGEITTWNAMRKAVAVARTYPRSVVLAADTLVALDRTIIGKPRDLAHARTILRRLSGKEHCVCSGVFVGRLEAGVWRSFVEHSTVRFRRLSEVAIDNYLDKINPLDKAGAYAAQEDDSEIIERVTGSFTNVVGLPMEKTIALLREFGVTPKKLAGPVAGAISA
jgi:septum formation protein